MFIIGLAVIFALAWMFVASFSNAEDGRGFQFWRFK
jgi:hypothetical protein